MHFTSIATGIFCLVSLVVAQPLIDSAPDACCCCDISRNVISCNRNILSQECVCAAVVCPANAPTVYDDGMPPPTSTATIPKPAPPVEQTPAAVLEKKDAANTANACCCCDISKNVISCSRNLSRDQCVCAAVMCPKDAPTVWTDSKKDTIRAPVMNKVERFVTVTKPAEPAPMPTAGKFSCCCCNPGINKIVCAVREQDDCVCAAVACPKNAETIFAQPPASTNI